MRKFSGQVRTLAAALVIGTMVVLDVSGLTTVLFPAYLPWA